MTQLAAPRDLVLDADDLHKAGFKLKKVYSDPKALAQLTSWGCLAECTSEFDDRHRVQVRSSAEIYPDASHASDSLHWFISLVARQHAQAATAPAIGVESALFVTAILVGRKRVMSHAFCWRQGATVGKMTVIGPAEYVDKESVARFAGLQAGRIAR